jgi:hypothetical protein
VVFLSSIIIGLETASAVLKEFLKAACGLFLGVDNILQIL